MSMTAMSNAWRCVDTACTTARGSGVRIYLAGMVHSNVVEAWMYCQHDNSDSHVRLCKCKVNGGARWYLIWSLQVGRERCMFRDELKLERLCSRLMIHGYHGVHDVLWRVLMWGRASDAVCTYIDAMAPSKDVEDCVLLWQQWYDISLVLNLKS